MRAGMVYVQPSLLGWKPLVQSWLETLSAAYTEHHRSLIVALCDWLLPPTLRLVTKFLVQPVAQQEQVLVTSLLRLLASEMRPVLDPPEGQEPKVMKPADVDAALQNMFIFALVWSCGASVDEDGRTEFDQQVRLYLQERCAHVIDVEH